MKNKLFLVLTFTNLIILVLTSFLFYQARTINQKSAEEWSEIAEARQDKYLVEWGEYFKQILDDNQKETLKQVNEIIRESN